MTPRDLNLGCAKGYLHMGRLKDALVELSEIEDRGEACEQTRQMVVGILLQWEDWSRLHAYGNQIVMKTLNSSPTGWIAVLYALVGKGELDAALGRARMAVHSCRTCSGLWYELARIHILKKDFLNADDAFARAYELNPNSLVVARKDGDFAAYFVWYRDIGRHLAGE